MAVALTRKCKMDHGTTMPSYKGPNYTGFFFKIWILNNPFSSGYIIIWTKLNWLVIVSAL